MHPEQNVIWQHHVPYPVLQMLQLPSYTGESGGRQSSILINDILAHSVRMEQQFRPVPEMLHVCSQNNIC